MKALVATDYGSFDNLKFAEIEKPVPGEGEILVKTRAVSVNPVDWKIVTGQRQGSFPAVFPYVVGWDLSGIVEDRGHAARRFNVGDKVYGYIRRPQLKDGTYSEYVLVPECYLCKAPDKISLKDASAIPLAGLTAYQALTVFGHLHRGETIMILGASGGVGTLAVQISKIMGAKIIAIASASNLDFLKNIGADYCFDYNDATWVEKVTEISPDLVLDCAGGETRDKGVPAVSKEGRVVSLTAREFPDKTINFTGMLVEPHSLNLELLTSWIEQGKLKPFVSKYFKFDHAIEALKLNQEGKTRGKIVVTIGD